MCSALNSYFGSCRILLGRNVIYERMMQCFYVSNQDTACRTVPIRYIPVLKGIRIQHRKDLRVFCAGPSDAVGKLIPDGESSNCDDFAPGESI